MNTLGISFPYEFALQSADLNWHDILLAIENGYLHQEAAIKHAINVLKDSDDYPQAVMDLAILTANEIVYAHSIYPFINDVADMVSNDEKEKSKNKLMYIVLKWVLENKDIYDNCFDEITTPDGSLTVVEFIYHNFGFPSEINHFANWQIVSCPVAHLRSKEQNINSIYLDWKNILMNKVWFGKN